MKKNSTIYVAGHSGLVGSAIVRHLEINGYENILYKSHKELDLKEQSDVRNFFQSNKIDYVFVSAARVGGIHANKTYIADFLYDNTMIAFNIIKAAAETDIKKLIFLGSSCIYPKLCPQPIKEEYLLSGYLEASNEGYALAKIAGLKLCEYMHKQFNKNFISAMPCNLYGPNDNYHPLESHVIPGLIRRFHEAKKERKNTVTVWGTGTPLREFMYVDDLVNALILLMNDYNKPETINIGSGEEVTIYELAHHIKAATGFEGGIEFDSSYPDGTPRKVLDATQIHNLGWKPSFNLSKGLKLAYESALKTGRLD